MGQNKTVRGELVKSYMLLKKIKGVNNSRLYLSLFNLNNQIITMSNNHIIEQIIKQADIVKIIGKHVELKKSGNEFKGCCPFHGEKTPSFFVNPEKGFYNCFGCGVKGNALTFLKEYENMTAGEALKELSRQTGIELPKEKIDKNLTYQRKPKQTNNQFGNGWGNNSNNSNNLNNNQQNFIQNFNDEYYQNFPPNVDNDNLSSQDIHENFHHHFDNPSVDNDVNGHFADNFSDNTANFLIEEQSDGSSSLYDLLTQVAIFYQQQLIKNNLAMNYFKTRGLTDNTIADFALGYAPSGWQHLEQAFPRDIDGLKILGLIRTSEKGRDYDLLRNRVIFPIRDNQGQVIGFAGRAMNDDDMPKYVNSSDSPVFHKQQILYGLYEGRQARAKNWLVVEGYMDVISLHQAGVYGAVASMGTAIATNQIDKLLQLNPVLTLSFDGDSAGQKAAWRAMEMGLPVLNDGKELRFLTLPNNHDPDSFVKAHGATAMQQQIHNAISLSQYLFSVLSQKYDVKSAEDRSKFLRDIYDLTKKLPKGTYGWLLREDMKNRLGLGFNKTQKNNFSQDALLNFHNELTPLLLLQMCFLYQPELLINSDSQSQATPFLLEYILLASGANKVPLFHSNIKKSDLQPIYDVNDENYQPTDDEKKSEYARVERLLKAESELEIRTQQYFQQNPLPNLTWQSVVDEQTLSLIQWIEKVQKNIDDLQISLTKSNANAFEIINAKAHFIMAGVSAEHQQLLISHWVKFFDELSRRKVTDVSSLVTEILAKQLLDWADNQMAIYSKVNVLYVNLFNKRHQAIYEWFQKWLQQKVN